MTFPYMHDGSFKNLELVIENYDKGGSKHINQSDLIKPLNLSAKEKEDLLHFLKAI
jgi:cytochrome c peroxidase